MVGPRFRAEPPRPVREEGEEEEEAPPLPAYPTTGQALLQQLLAERGYDPNGVYVRCCVKYQGVKEVRSKEAYASGVVATNEWDWQSRGNYCDAKAQEALVAMNKALPGLSARAAEAPSATAVAARERYIQSRIDSGRLVHLDDLRFINARRVAFVWHGFSVHDGRGYCRYKADLMNPNGSTFCASMVQSARSDEVLRLGGYFVAQGDIIRDGSFYHDAAKSEGFLEGHAAVMAEVAALAADFDVAILLIRGGIAQAQYDVGAAGVLGLAGRVEVGSALGVTAHKALILTTHRGHALLAFELWHAQATLPDSRASMEAAALVDYVTLLAVAVVRGSISDARGICDECRIEASSAKGSKFAFMYTNTVLDMAVAGLADEKEGGCARPDAEVDREVRAYATSHGIVSSPQQSLYAAVVGYMGCLGGGCALRARAVRRVRRATTTTTVRA